MIYYQYSTSTPESVFFLFLCLALLRHADATLDERWARCDVTSGKSCAVSVLLTKNDVTLLLSFDACSVDLEKVKSVVDRGDGHHICERTSCIVK